MVRWYKRGWAVLALGAGLLQVADAAVVYNENGPAGDLSNNGLSPTRLSLTLGSNQLFGSTGRDASGVIDRDYLTFTVPAGLQWTALNVLPGTGTIGSLSFIGLEQGGQVTLSTTPTSAAGLLGWRHYSTSDINTNILPAMGGAQNGSSGFSTPLPAGTYSLWIQETGSGSVPYGFDIVLSATPEPETYVTVLLALAALAAYRRRAGTALPRA
jgi:MYXO-CTERM domain-containing protein